MSKSRAMPLLSLASSVNFQRKPGLGFMLNIVLRGA